MGAFTNRLSFIVTVATRKEIIANEARTLFQAKNGEINYMFDGIDRTSALSYHLCFFMLLFSYQIIISKQKVELSIYRLSLSYQLTNFALSYQISYQLSYQKFQMLLH